ncbi:MAG: DUF4293 domain-containing protein [Bacteroidales bacterium]|nr:DUF4293 domain-containing protein [Bacteroidales bacterium]
MLQRIQSVWLALAVILSALAFYFPLAIYVLPDGQEILYKLIPEKMSIDATSFQQQKCSITLIILNCVVLVLSLITIFLYKNRQNQLKVLAIAFLALVAYTCVWFFYEEKAGLNDILTTWLQPEKIKSYTESAKTNYGFASYFPIMQMVLLVFARNGIRKDEKLVRSSEHLR